MKKMKNQECKEGKDKKGCRLHSRQEARNPWFPFRPISALSSGLLQVKKTFDPKLKVVLTKGSVFN